MFIAMKEPSRKHSEAYLMQPLKRRNPHEERAKKIEGQIKEILGLIKNNDLPQERREDLAGVALRMYEVATFLRKPEKTPEETKAAHRIFLDVAQDLADLFPKKVG